MHDHKYILEPYKGNNRYKCPECGHNKQFARYIDTDTMEHLSDHVGRCNRENACGYHFTPSDWIKTGGKPENAHVERRNEPILEPLPISYIPHEIFKTSFNGFKTTNFGKWLISLFGEVVGHRLLLQYFIGRSKEDNGQACIFWRVDESDNVMSGKIMCYNPVTGKRNKEIMPIAVSGLINRKREKDGLEKLRFEQCFFGQHLLAIHPDKPIGIVESEKSAVIASVYMPQFIWIATGGASGCKWRVYEVYKALKDRTCIFFPDFGYFNRKTQKTCYQEWSERVDRIADVLPGKFKVSRLLEDLYGEDDRLKDIDLVDHLLITDESGMAITDYEYPVIWDLNIAA